MKIFFFLSSLLAVMPSAAAAKEGPSPEEMLAATAGNPNFNYQKQRVLNDAFDINQPEPEEEVESGDVPIGRRCGRRNKCMEGLDCVQAGSAFIKICLPMSCLDSVVEEYNVLDEDTGRNLFGQYYHDVMEGAHKLHPDIPTDGSLPSAETFLNHSTVELGMEGAASKNNFMNVMRSDVRDALTTSLIQLEKENPLQTEVLNAKAGACFEPFMQGGNRGGRDLNEQSPDRDLEDLGTETVMFTLPGFFLELSAVFQFTYALGVLNDEEFFNQTDVLVHDICFGAGPTAGGGTGFLLQFWWIPNPLDAPENEFTDRILGREDPDEVDPNAAVFCPVPSIMLDVDAALGPGFGMAYNTFAFACHRLWLKFYIGAGGGLAFSLCWVGADIEDLFGNLDDSEGEEGEVPDPST